MSTTGSGPGRQAAERTDQGSRGTSGGRSNGSAGPGAYNGQGRPNAMAAALAGPTGLRGPLGPTGAAGFTNQTGPAGAPTGQSNPGQVGTGGVGSNYEAARSDYISNYRNDIPSRVAKFFTGVGLQQPNINRPSTYANGLSHTGVDPLGAALGVAGMAFPPAIAAGKLYSLGKLATGYDGPEITIGNASPAAPQPGQGFNYSGTGPQGHYGPGTSAPGQTGALGNPTQGGSMGTPAMPLGGAPFGAQPSAPALGAPAAPASGMTGIANHSLPYGYNSMFPNSLTDQDKALLYAKALGGSMG